MSSLKHVASVKCFGKGLMKKRFQVESKEQKYINHLGPEGRQIRLFNIPHKNNSQSLLTCIDSCTAADLPRPSPQCLVFCGNTRASSICVCSSYYVLPHTHCNTVCKGLVVSTQGMTGAKDSQVATHPFDGLCRWGTSSRVQLRAWETLPMERAQT